VDNSQPDLAPWRRLEKTYDDLHLTHKKWQSWLVERDEQRPVWNRWEAPLEDDMPLLDWEDKFRVAAEAFGEAVREAAGATVELPETHSLISATTHATPYIGLTRSKLAELGRSAWLEAQAWRDRALDVIAGRVPPLAWTQEPRDVTVDLKRAIAGVPELGLPPIPESNLRRWHRDPQKARDLGVDPRGSAQLAEFRVSALRKLCRLASNKKTRQPPRD